MNKSRDVNLQKFVQLGMSYLSFLFQGSLVILQKIPCPALPTFPQLLERIESARTLRPTWLHWKEILISQMT